MTVQIAVRLPDDLVADIDRIVGAKGRPANRTEAVRQALEVFVRAELRRQIDEALVRGYTLFPTGTVDEWGDLDAQTEANHRRTIAELDREDGGW
jgi:Arc/MetJ-type ribon-helix-helix transcriptional regulator